jgi:hypothetical protein
MMLALQIEKRHTKEDLHDDAATRCTGAITSTASKARRRLVLRSKHVSELNLDEAALIAGLLRAT